MIADSTPDSGKNAERHSIAIDDRAISQAGWLTLDLSGTRDIPAGGSFRAPRSGATLKEIADASPGDDCDDVISLGLREMAGAAMMRAVQVQAGDSAEDDLADDDTNRQAWRLARRARALARARGQFPQGRAAADRAHERSAASAPSAIPSSAIIPVGGTDLQAFTPAQPFPRDDEAANDNRFRMLLMTALLVGISAGYALTAKTGSPAREGFDVPAPLVPEVRVSLVAPLTGGATTSVALPVFGAFAIFPASV